MADITDNQILLRLVIKGMDPSEVQRLADESYGELKTKAVGHIDAITAAMRAAAEAQLRIAKDSADQAAQADKDAADEKIAAETKALDAVTKLMRQQEIEANKARGAWHGIMEDLENITTVATAGFKIMSDGFERLKSAAEEIIHDTNIYNSLTGSIEEMKVATDGTVANIDLISAKNRALEKDLKLTDEEFGTVAAAATHYAHAVGIDAKEALDKMIDGMATGRVKMLEHAGITVDAALANEKWAEKMGTTVEAMTNQEKLIAFQTEALEKMRNKMEEVAEEPDTLAMRFERGFVRIKNAITDTAAAIGNIHVDQIFSFTPEQLGAQFDAAREAQKKADKAIHDRLDAEYAAQEAGLEAEHPATNLPIGNTELSDAFGKMKKGDKKGDAAEKARQAGAAEVDSFYRKLGGYQGTGASPQSSDEAVDLKAALTPQAGDNGTQTLEDYVKAADAANAAAEKNFLTMEKGKGIAIDTAAAYGKLATTLGLDADALSHEEKMQALQNEAAVQADKLAKDAKAKADARRAELKATSDKAGFMGVFLWGTGGPEESYKQMDEFQQRLVDTMGSVSNSLKSQAEALAGAVGKGIGAAIAGADAGSKSIKQLAHDALIAMAEQAAGKAVWEGAEALASAAVGNFEGAGLHTAAAAAYAGVAVTAGLGARAIGNSPSTAAGASSKQTSGLQQSSSNQFGSATRSSPANNNGAPAPLPTINLVVFPGGEAEAGRQVKKALDAYTAQTGQQTLMSA